MISIKYYSITITVDCKTRKKQSRIGDIRKPRNIIIIRTVDYFNNLSSSKLKLNSQVVGLLVSPFFKNIHKYNIK